MRKAIFLDRDGTINIDKEYVYAIEDLEFEKNSIEGLKILSELNYLLIVITNQSGIGRGYFTERQLRLFNEEMNKRLNHNGVNIEKFYFCPHYFEQGIEIFEKKCNCRKPSPEMLRSGIKEFDIDIKKSYMVGDRFSDIKAGLNAGVKPVLVKTGLGKLESLKMGDITPMIFEDLLDFALYLRKEERK